MARVSLELENTDDLNVLQADRWRIAPGLVPGEPNQGLVAERRGSPPRLADFDDSGWAVGDIQERRSVGLTFAWYRLRFTMPETVKGQAVGGNQVFFECNVDNYGEVWVDGVIDRTIGAVTGNNTPKRVPVHASAVPGEPHVIAVLVANAPLGDPVGRFSSAVPPWPLKPPPGNRDTRHRRTGIRVPGLARGTRRPPRRPAACQHPRPHAGNAACGSHAPPTQT
jgi:hypothetical protein